MNAPGAPALTALPDAPPANLRRITAAGIVVVAALALLMAQAPRWMLRVQAASFDAYQIVHPRERTSEPVIIVDIDDKSRAARGQWPWKRTVLADLLRGVLAQKPAAVALDILMSEPDRLSPEQLGADFVRGDAALAEKLAGLPSYDAELARTIRTGPVVLGVADGATPPGAVMRTPPVELRHAGADGAAGVAALADLPRLPGAVPNLPILEAAAAGHGFMSIGFTEETVRRVPLLFDVRGTLAPSLVLELFRVATGRPSVAVEAADGRVTAVGIGDFVVPTEDDGSVRLWFARHAPGRFVSAIDVLEGKVAPDRFRDRLVIVAVGGLGLGDLWSTPLRERMRGDEIHAQLVENLFDRNALVRPHYARALEIGGFVLLGLALIGATPRWRPRDSALLAFGCVLLPVVGAYVAFRLGHLVFDALVPALGLLLVYTLLVATTLGESTRQRRALEEVVQQQREREAYVAGELEAAKRIQTGILPRTDLVAGDPRVELAATMLPAREVGGDLYDFFYLDANRLFLLVGDVAGKGLPASIFMAVCKALYKSAVLRTAVPVAEVRDSPLDAAEYEQGWVGQSGSVGLLMTAANAEVSRDNSESLFVTAFAAILDLETGMLEYCNAGHDNPAILDPQAGTVSTIEDGDGPPLCAVDDFPYASARRRLAPGQLLCLSTDGVLEAQDRGGALYGSARLAAVLSALARPATTAQALVDGVRADVAAFAAGADPADDLTVLALRYRGPAA